MRANGRYGRDGSLTHAASALEAPAFTGELTVPRQHPYVHICMMGKADEVGVEPTYSCAKEDRFSPAELCRFTRLVCSPNMRIKVDRRDGSRTHAASALEAPAFRRPSFPFLRNVYRPPEWNRTTINRESSGRSATELRVRASCQSRTDDLPLTRRPLWPTELRRHTNSSQDDCFSHSQGGVSDLATGHLPGQSGSATRLHCRPSTSSDRIMGPADSEDDRVTTGNRTQIRGTTNRCPNH